MAQATPGLVPRIGLIGCGAWGANIAETLARLGALSWIVTRDPTKAKVASDRFGLPFVGSVDDLLVMKDLAAVAIATPAHTHAGLVLRALETRRSVFVEKPLALSLADARACAQGAAAVDGQLMIGHLLRFHPCFERLQALLIEGRVGRLLSIESLRRQSSTRASEPVLWNLGPHDVSLIHALVDAGPVRVAAKVPPGQRYRDAVDCRVEFDHGVVAKISLSCVAPAKVRRFTVVGEDGRIVFDDLLPHGDKLRLFGRNTEEAVVTTDIPPLEREMRAFVQMIQGGTSVINRAEEGVATVAVLQALEDCLREAPGASI